MMEVIVAVVVGVLGLVGNERTTQPASPGWHYVQVEGERGPVKGAIYVPRGVDASAPAPALVFLHGYGECGTDGSNHLTVGLPPAVMRAPERWPFVIVAPQKPEHNAEWEDFEDAVLAMLDLAVAEFNADAGRVAITGLSQGGHGTITIASRNPGRFVATAPVCGYIERWNTDGAKQRVPTRHDSPAMQAAARALANHPVWLFHGGADDVVPALESETLHEALIGAGNTETKLTIFPRANHNSWDLAYNDTELWRWLAQQLDADG